MKGNFLTSGRPIETICNTIESSGTLWISGVENFSNALKSASEKNLQQTPETDGKFLNNICITLDRQGYRDMQTHEVSIDL